MKKPRFDPPPHPQKRGRGRPPIPAVSILVRVPLPELAALDRWIADQPKPPTRPVALRRLAVLGLRGKPAKLPRPPTPVPPAGIVTPGGSWRWAGGRWVANWQAQRKFVKLNYPSQHVHLWDGASPSPDDWRMIGARCVKLQREMKEWDPEDDARRLAKNKRRPRAPGA